MIWAGMGLVALAGLTWAAVGVVMSQGARKALDFGAYYGTLGVAITVLAWAFLPRYAEVAGQRESLPALAWLMMVGGFLAALGTLSLQSAMRRGHHAACWTVGQSALLVPFLANVIWYHERAGVTQWLGVAAILASLAAFGLAQGADGGEEDAGRNGGRAWFFLALAAFALYGTQQTLSTVPSHWAGWSDAAHLRVPLVYAGCLPVYLVVLILRWRHVTWRTTWIALAMAAVIVPWQVSLFRGLDIMAAAGMAGIAFPVAVMTSVLGFGLYSLLVIKEAATPVRVVGMACGALGIVLVAVR